MRNHRHCKTLEANGFCKRGNKCAYSHRKIRCKSDIESAIKEIDVIKKEFEKLKHEMANLIKTKSNEKSLELSIERLRTDIITLQMENREISKNIKIIEYEDNQKSESKVEISFEKTMLNDKNTNEIHFDISRLDKWLVEDEEIESDNENKGEVLIEYGFHFQMEVIDGETVFACNIRNGMFETSEIVEKHIMKEHNNEFKDFEKDYEDNDEPEDTTDE